MPKSNKPSRQPSPQKILDLLEELYPNAGSELNFRDEFELVVAVVLSAQCTDKKVNQVTPELFRLYPNFAALASAKEAQLLKIVRPINYYKTKTRNLIALAQLVCSNFFAKLPREMAELLTLPGVGRKTASVLACELGFAPALPVDTHVMRLSKRLGLSAGKDPLSVELDLAAIFPPSSWRALHHGLILHGRRVCKAQNPNCSECVLAKLCPSKMASAKSAESDQTLVRKKTSSRTK